jgi:hypothetical protein
MMTQHEHSAPLPVALCVLLAMLGTHTAVADENDPPSRAARLAYAQGAVSFQPAGTQDWVTAPINRPLTTGDQLWADRDGRAELQLGASTLRLSSSTAVSFLNLGDQVTQIQLSAGTLVVHVRRLGDQETYEIDTPNLAFTVLRPGVYRLSTDESGNSTTVSVRSGQGEVTGGGAAYSIGPGENDVFTGTEQLVENPQASSPQQDSFDAWSAGRDARWDHSPSSQYVSADVVGYEDLDEHGSWTATPEYGHVWFPRGVSADWAPYHEGHWAYIEPWGYTWVDDSSWGFAPFHYGRWISVRGAWGWVPAPPAVEGVVYVAPVYAPALVAWVGVGAGVAWFALAPREVYVPSYPVSRNYVTNVNVSNTTVNTTVINNVYNNTVVNNNVTNVTYVNRTIPGAVAATTTQAFASAQPVHKNPVQIDAKSIVSAPVKAAAPAVVPTKQAVLGASHPTTASTPKPPPAVAARSVVARTAPPAPPPTFERRQEAIKNNGGKPLSVAQVHQMAATTPARAVAVKIAPPAPPPKPVAAAPHVATPVAPAATTRPEANPATPTAAATPQPSHETSAARPATPPSPPARTEPSAPTPQPSRPPTPVVHPSEMPAVAKPPSPSGANSALEREHLQQQQQLHAQQEAERQRLQQQQEQEHQLLAKEAADRARQQQIEQQHAQQTQALAQKHAQEQEQMRARQEAQRRLAPPPPPPPPPRKDERPPVPK